MPVFVWTIHDALGAAAIVLMLTAWLVVSVIEWWRQFRCKHDDGVTETQACDAICRRCGKNLGFIGNLHKKKG